MSAGRRKMESGIFRRGRVLVVENETLEGRRLGEAIIEHEFVAVGSGGIALALIAMGRLYDLILCDVMLRDMTGVELFSRLWCDHPGQGQRLVFMARQQVSTALQYLLDAVPNLCIESPVDLDGLRALIERRTRSSRKAPLAQF
jgi:CheY-like chemotaxis protein